MGVQFNGFRVGFDSMGAITLTPVLLSANDRAIAVACVCIDRKTRH